MIKKIGIWLAGVVSALLLIAGILFLVVFRPLMKSVEVAKPKIAEAAFKFSECTEGTDISACISFTSENFQRVSPVIEWNEFNARMHSILGKRMTAELDEESVNVTTFNFVTGVSSKQFKARFKAMYEKDPFVIENYIFNKVGDSDKYLIEAFNINSKLLVK